MALTPDEPTTPGAASRWAGRIIFAAAGVSLAIGGALLLLFGFTGAGPGFAVLGLILLVVFGFLEPDTVRAFVGQGELQAGTRAVTQAVLVVAAIILINLVVRDRLANAKVDVTKGKVNTLAPQTVTVLNNLDHPVTATVWYAQQPSEMDTAYNLLKQYHNVSSRLTVQRFSTLERPDLLTKQKAAADTVVFEYQNRAPQITSQATEQDFTTSLLRLSTGKSPKAYFLTGHGEGDINAVSQNGTSFTALKQLLDKQGITSASLNLAAGAGGSLNPSGPALGASPSPAAASSPEPAPSGSASPAPTAAPAPGTSVPADADEVVILDPQGAFSDAEIASLSAYVSRGGHLLVSSPPLARNNLNKLVSKYGLSFGGGIVLDQQLHYQNTSAAQVLLITQFGKSVVTTGLDTLPVVLLGSTSVDGQAPQGYTLTPLISTAGDACLRTNLSITTADCQASDKKGPFSMASTLEQGNARAGARPIRIIVFGGAAFANDLVASQASPPPGNMQLMVNAVNWLAGQDKVINIPARTTTPEAVFLTEAQRQLILIGYPFLLPLLVVAYGVSVYLRRRQ
jgi:hypothetical protein